jgi:hypothetical protein
LLYDRLAADRIPGLWTDNAVRNYPVVALKLSHRGLGAGAEYPVCSDTDSILHLLDQRSPVAPP